MTEDLRLKRKYTLRAHDRQMVFTKKPFESSIHVLTKAFINEIVSICRSAPVDLISIPDDSDDRFIGHDGVIRIKFKDVHHVRCSSNSHQCAVPA